MLRDNHWYRMLTRPNVELVTAPVERITPTGVAARDDTEHPANVIVYATGFHAQRMLAPMEITGRSGANVRDLWGEDESRANLGITAPNFPDLFMVYGPGTNLAHGGSIIFHTECQVRYIMQCLREMLKSDADAMECRPEPFAEYNDLLDATHQDMVWAHRGVGSWYKNTAGRVVTNSPFRPVDYHRMTETLKRDDYVMA